MKRIKKLLSLLITFTLIFTMSGVVYAAADDTATISAYEKTDKKVAELSAATCTIKKNDNKYYYKNASGKTDKKTGWKKNQNGQYVYYVGSKGYVTEKISGGYWYHFSGKKFVKKSLSSYKNKTKTIGKKIFFVNSKGKIVLKSGWKKLSGVYTYYVSGTGTASVKLTGKKYYKVSSGSWKAQSLKKYKNDRIKVKGKYFYVDKNGSMIRTAKTVKSGNYKFTIKADGTCTKTKIKTEIKDNADNKKEDSDKDTDSGKKETTPHVCQWLQVTDENGEDLITNRVDHPKKSHIETQMLRDAWDEPIRKYKIVCKTCRKYFPLESEDGGAAWAAHSNETHHGNTSTEQVIVSYTHHDPTYGPVEVLDEREYSEWDYTYKCTVCGDTMTEHVICGKVGIEKYRSEYAYIYDKGGQIIYRGRKLGGEFVPGVYYGIYRDSVKDNEYTKYLQLLKDHHFID